jgi:hypothetical protein
MAIYEAGGITSEPQCCLGDIFRESGSFDWLEWGQRFFHNGYCAVCFFRREPEGLAKNRSSDATGAYAVHSDITLTELHRDGSSQMNHRRFSRTVNVGAVTRPEARCACHIDYRSCPLWPHYTSCMLHSEKDSPEKDSHRLIERISWDFFDRPDWATKTSIVKHAVKASKQIQRMVNQGRNIRLLTNVCWFISSISSEVLGESLSPVVLYIRYDYLCSGIDKESSHRISDSTRTASYDSYLALQCIHFFLPDLRPVAKFDNVQSVILDCAR